MENLISIVRIFAGIILTLFLPGLLLSYVFFRKRQIDVIERTALAFALSIAIVPLVVFYTNLLGIPITFETVLLQITALMLLTLFVLLIRLSHEPDNKK